MENPEGIERLYFELASESRLGILRELSKKNWKMNDVAHKLDLTTTEAFRQLQRLTEMQLAQKKPDATYTITQYGRLVLYLSTPLEFVHKHKQYFLTHDIWSLPPQFLCRLGELSGAILQLDSIQNLNWAAKVTREADQYMWGGGSEQPLDIGHILTENLPKGVKYRWLFPERFLSKEGIPPPLCRFVEWRSLDNMPVNVVLTEKEAGVTFCLFGGKADYAGFTGEDSAFVNWTKDLFLYYWEKGKRPPS